VRCTPGAKHATCEGLIVHEHDDRLPCPCIQMRRVPPRSPHANQLQCTLLTLRVRVNLPVATACPMTAPDATPTGFWAAPSAIVASIDLGHVYAGSAGCSVIVAASVASIMIWHERRRGGANLKP